MTHIVTYLHETKMIADALDVSAIHDLVVAVRKTREKGGRLFLAGLGGSAANCSHAANDFRKLIGLEAYALHENGAELTAIANDEGWIGCLAGVLRTSRAAKPDALMVLSVGGGADGVSLPIIAAIDYARDHDMLVLGIVGRDGGYTKANGDHVVLIPNVHADRVTPHTEAFQMVLLHLLVSHPSLQTGRTKW